MATRIEMADDQRYLIVTQEGMLNPEEIMAARQASLPYFKDADRVLVDYRAAELSGLSLLQIDTLAAGLKRDVPGCQRMALLRTAGRDERLYRHLANVCNLSGVPTRLFLVVEEAVTWLSE